MLSSLNSFLVGEEEYRFEIMAALYTTRPLQLLDQKLQRLEDRFHRTVNITRLSDSHSWTGAADMESWYMNNLDAHLQRWLEDCFTAWDLSTIPEGFEIPQGNVPHGPAKHHCPEFPVLPDRRESKAFKTTSSNPFEIVDTASEDSFPASDSPEWTGVSLG